MLSISDIKRMIECKPKEVVSKMKSLVLNIPHNVYAERISTLDLVDRIYTFCELYSGITLYPYQEQFGKRVIRSVLDNDGQDITALFSRQSGKSETISVIVGGLMIILPKLANMPMFAGDKRLEMFKDGFWVGIFAPSMRQAQITYNRMRARIQSKSAIAVLADPDFRLEFDTSNGQTVSLTNGSFATSISASDTSNIEGESFKFIICEECQDISNYKIRKSIEPMGSAYNSTIAKIGTPTTFKGDFYEAIQRNIRDFESGEIKIKNHFEYNYKIVMKYNPQYARAVEKAIKKYGEDSDEFRMSYKLEWILQRSMFVEYESFISRNADLNAQRVSTDKSKDHIAGIDLGGINDDTVITIIEVDWEFPVVCESQYNEETGETETFEAYDTMIKDWLELFGNDYEVQYHQITDYLKLFKLRRAIVDATRESSVAHRLRANMPFEVVPFVFTSKSKSEMYKHLDTEIKSGRAKFPFSKEVKNNRECQKFLQQLQDLQKSYSGANLVVAHPPERNAHDDYPDSWALAVWGAMTPGETTSVEVQNENPLMKNQLPFIVKYARNRVTARRR